MTPRTALSHALGLIGAAIGGVVGFFAFRWILSQGLYALILPGAMLGAGCGALARHPSLARGVACGLAGLDLGLVCEWKFFPFVADEGLGYFLAHLHQLKPISILMILAGAYMAYWMGRGSRVEWPAKAPAARGGVED